MTIRVSLKDVVLANPLYALARMTAWTVDVTGAKTGTKATLYSAPTGTATATNPQTLDSEGKLASPIYIESPVIITMSGIAGVDDHDSGIIPVPGNYRGAWATATVYYPGDMVSAEAAADGTLDLLISNAFHTSGNFTTDTNNGLWGVAVSMYDFAQKFSLLDPAGSPLYVPRVNVTASAYELITPAALLAAIGAQPTITETPITYSINQTFSGTVADGDVVYWDQGNTRWEQALAGGGAADRAAGVADVTNSRVILSGLLPAGLMTGLTAGLQYYLSDAAAGQVTATAPNDRITIGVATATNMLVLNIDRDRTPLNAGRLVLIEEKVASNNPSLDFTTGLDGTYDDYVFKFEGILPDADDCPLRMRVSDDGGVSWEQDAADYWYGLTALYVGSTFTSAGSNGTAQIFLTGSTVTAGIGTAAGENGFFGEMTFSSPDVATKHHFRWKASYGAAYGGLAVIDGAAMETAGAAINGIQFYVDKGGGQTIESGSIRLYGVAK